MLIGGINHREAESFRSRRNAFFGKNEGKEVFRPAYVDRLGRDNESFARKIHHKRRFVALIIDGVRAEMVIGKSDFGKNVSHFGRKPTARKSEYAVAVYERLLRFCVILRPRYGVTVGRRLRIDKIVNRFHCLDSRRRYKFIRRETAVFVVIVIVIVIALGIYLVPQTVEEPVHIVDGKAATERFNGLFRPVVYNPRVVRSRAKIQKPLNGFGPFALDVFAVRFYTIEIILIVNETPTRIDVTRKIMLVADLAHIENSGISDSFVCGRAVLIGRQNVVYRSDKSVTSPFYPVVHLLTDEVHIVFFAAGSIHILQKRGRKIGIGGNVYAYTRFFVISGSDVVEPVAAESCVDYLDVYVVADATRIARFFARTTYRRQSRYRA